MNPTVPDCRVSGETRTKHRTGVLSLDSPACPPACGGGARRDRTADPLLAKQVLSQLSYGPLNQVSGIRDQFFLIPDT